tara:strand:- start:7308 stop:7553 length:246 start_codon:yes stop_codon:yes gene_type:complete
MSYINNNDMPSYGLTSLGEAYIWLKNEKIAAIHELSDLSLEEQCSAIKEMLKNHPDKLWLDLTPDNYLELCINLIPDSLSS